MPTPQNRSPARHTRCLDPEGSRSPGMHGTGISRRIVQITGGVYEVKAGSLFPPSHRMEQAGWLKSSWGEIASGLRTA
jgi:DNA-binding PadR family transcriptional regulator